MRTHIPEAFAMSHILILHLRDAPFTPHILFHLKPVEASFPCDTQKCHSKNPENSTNLDPEVKSDIPSVQQEVSIVHLRVETLHGVQCSSVADTSHSDPCMSLLIPRSS